MTSSGLSVSRSASSATSRGFALSRTATRLMTTGQPDFAGDIVGIFRQDAHRAAADDAEAEDVRC